jgi:hypothetical protein
VHQNGSPDYARIQNSSHLIDVLWLLGVELENSEHYRGYISLLHSLLNNHMISTNDCIEQLDDKALAGCRLIPDINQFRKRTNRIRTKFM